jgi:hypothetical protein
LADLEIVAAEAGLFLRALTIWLKPYPNTNLDPGRILILNQSSSDLNRERTILSEALISNESFRRASAFILIILASSG